MGRSVPDSGFNVQANNVSPGLRLLFGRPQCAFQITRQTVSARQNQVNTMKQEGNWGAVQHNLIMQGTQKILIKSINTGVAMFVI